MSRSVNRRRHKIYSLKQNADNMRAFISFLIVAVFGSFQKPEPTSETITYISLNRAIHLGQLDGVSSIAAAKRCGNFGLGSEAKLKREIILIDGAFYGIPADGKATKVSDRDSLAFAAVKTFKSDTSFIVKNITDLANLEATLSSAVRQNQFSAIRIDGTFEWVELRSFEAQRKPYKPIDEIPEVKYVKEHLQGTMVGFFTPKSALVLNSPSFHFHFIDDKRSTGGHLLECKLVLGEVTLDYAESLQVILPEEKQTRHIDLNTEK